MLVFKL